MKLFTLAAVAALSALALPAVASAEEKMTYDTLMHCAAFNKVVGDAMGSGADAEKNKAKAEAFNNQSVSLMAIAAVGDNKTAEQVLADLTKRTEGVLTAMIDKTSGTDYIKTNYEKCNVMGQAAVQVVEESKKTK